MLDCRGNTLRRGRTGEIDDKDAARTRPIVHVQLAIVCLDASPGNGKPKSQARSIAAALVERLEQLLGSSYREAAALVGDFDQNTTIRGLGTQRDVAVGGGKRDGILHEVRDSGRNRMAVGVDRESCVGRPDVEREAFGTGLEAREDPDLFEQLANENPFPMG